MSLTATGHAAVERDLRRSRARSSVTAVRGRRRGLDRTRRRQHRRPFLQASAIRSSCCATNRARQPAERRRRCRRRARRRESPGAGSRARTRRAHRARDNARAPAAQRVDRRSSARPGRLAEIERDRDDIRRPRRPAALQSICASELQITRDRPTTCDQRTCWIFDLVRSNLGPFTPLPPAASSVLRVGCAQRASRHITRIVSSPAMVPTTSGSRARSIASAEQLRLPRPGLHHDQLLRDVDAQQKLAERARQRDDRGRG